MGICLEELFSGGLKQRDNRKPGQRYENNTKLKVRETEGKFVDCMKLVTDRNSENRATHDLVG